MFLSLWPSFRAVVVLCFLSTCLLSRPLDPAREERVKNLYRLFTAPCCWRQCVAEHQSPEATKVRKEIKDLVVEGKTDSQVKSALVQHYGKAILLVPDGIDGFIVFAVPTVVTLASLVLLSYFVRRLAAVKKSPPEQTASVSEEWLRRIENDPEFEPEKHV